MAAAAASVFHEIPFLLPMNTIQATALRIHPLKLMMPITVASSFAFMLPVATPPNAMVYEHSNMPITYMVRIRAWSLQIPYSTPSNRAPITHGFSFQRIFSPDSFSSDAA